jgi:hypothetical protein
MPMLSEIDVLYQALGSPLGLVIRVSNFALAQQRLYKARRDASDPDLACLQLRRSPLVPDSELWIVKGGDVAVPKTNGAAHGEV